MRVSDKPDASGSARPKGREATPHGSRPPFLADVPSSEGASSSASTREGSTSRGARGSSAAGARRRGDDRRASGRPAGRRAPEGAGSPAGKAAHGTTGHLPRVTLRNRRKGVVGSRIGEVSGGLQGRGLPRGGIKGQTGLVVDKSATGDVGSRRDGAGAGRAVRVVAIVVAVLLALTVVFLIAVTVLSHTSAFTIDSVEAADSAHVTADSIVRLANVEEGATLLNVDTKAIEANLERNPWIVSARITREFPDKLRIEVTERQPAYLVVMSTGNLGWYLGSDNVWIEPKRIETSGDQSASDAAMSLASDAGAIVIADVPASVSPVAGSTCTDSEILTVEAFQDQFSDDLRSQIASYSAPDTNGISCVLQDGVQISLGSASNIDTKEAVIKQVLQEYGGQITYLNVRVPSSPSYRGLSGDNLTQGTGATGSSTDGGSSFTSTIADADGQVPEGSDTTDSSGSTSATAGSSGTSSASTSQSAASSGTSSSGSGSATTGSSGSASASSGAGSGSSNTGGTATSSGSSN